MYFKIAKTFVSNGDKKLLFILVWRIKQIDDWNHIIGKYYFSRDGVQKYLICNHCLIH